MTRENYEQLVHAQRFTGPQQFRVILQRLRLERDNDAELFAMVGDHNFKWLRRERFGGPGSKWLKNERGQDAELFAKVGDHGSKFTYCHLAVVKKPNG